MPAIAVKHILPGAAALQALLAVELLHGPSPILCFLCALLINSICYAFYSIFLYPAGSAPSDTSQEKNSLLGHALAEFEMPRGDAYRRFMDETPNTGLLHLHGLLGSEQLLLTNPTSLNEALIQKPYGFEWPPGDSAFLRRILGHGLITAEGAAHKAQRKQMAQSFGVKHIRSLYPLFWEKSTLMVQAIASEMKQNSSSESDVCSWAQRASLDIIGEAGFGWTFDTLREPENELAESFEKIFAPTAANALLFAVSVYGPEWALEHVPSGISRAFVTATSRVRDVCKAFIRSKAKATKARASHENDILAQLMKQDGMSEDSLVDQTLTFLTAGHETVAIALTWTLYLLAKHPDIQTALRNELHSSLSNATHKTPSTLAQTLESLPILNGVIIETLRLYPSAPVAVRVAIRNTSIMGQHIPQGTRLIIAPWSVNRSRDLWGPDAEEFQPSRWIDPDTGRASATSIGGKVPILTFLHGPRNCIGQGFAKAELLALVAVFIRAFEVDLPSDGYERVPGGSLSAKPKGGMRLRVKVLNAGLV
ncbi:cytochrome P450 [Aspergillus multicolor]|uniref:cytochrome P450 n=1 Tax=Aspergillus multicolor TaxID=41759 RepID=UPI003CCD9954